jgi:hypothetical protein
MIREMKNRNAEVLRAVADGLVRNPGDLSVGLQYAIDCFEMAPFNPQSEIEREQKRYPELRLWHEFVDEPALCSAWHDVRADSSESLAIQSDIPTLVLAGEFDPITPPSYGRLAVSTLSAGTFVEIPGVGHAVSPSSECTRDLLSFFLANPSQTLDTRCVREIRPVAFVTRVRLNPGIYRIASRLQPEPEKGILAGLGLIVFVHVTALILWPGGYVIRVIRKRTPEFSFMQKIARWLAAIASLFAISFLALLTATLLRVVTENPYLIAFGVPRSESWILLMPWIVLVLTPPVVIMAILAWKQKWWKNATRIHYSFVAAGCVVFTSLVILLKLIP